MDQLEEKIDIRKLKKLSGFKRELWKNWRYGYMCSNLGRIRYYNESPIKFYFTRDGYLQCNIYYNESWKTFRVHRIVAEVWLGKCPRKKQVNHKDGIKTNNWFTNLEYVTASENLKHAYVLNLRKRLKGKFNYFYGRNHSGELNGNSFLTDKQRISIVHKFKQGLSLKKLASIYNISAVHIGRIVKDKRWCNL